MRNHARIFFRRTLTHGADYCRSSQEGEGMTNHQSEVRGEMKEVIDSRYFEELADQDPREVCRRTLCRYDTTRRAYLVRAWNEEYIVDPHKGEIGRIRRDTKAPHAYFFLFMVYYLVKGKDLVVSNEWISEKDIPGGATFFRGPHEIPTHLISNRYGNDGEGFAERCKRVGGTPLDMGDAGFRFLMVPRIPVAVLYWKGDDEFPSQARILYDRTITEHLTADIIFALDVEICRRIAGQA